MTVLTLAFLAAQTFSQILVSRLFLMMFDSFSLIPFSYEIYLRYPWHRA